MSFSDWRPVAINVLSILGAIAIFPYAPSAAIRIGYNIFAIRFAGLIVGGRQDIFHQDHYSATLEVLWDLH